MPTHAATITTVSVALIRINDFLRLGWFRGPGKFSPLSGVLASQLGRGHSKSRLHRLASLASAAPDHTSGGPVLAPAPSRQDRMSMHNANKLKIGLFGANCSSGRAVTLVPERWSGSWPDNLKLAQMADDAGIDFLLPIGRWKGYGGDTDYQGATLETITWATSLLASTKHVTVFGM